MNASALAAVISLVLPALAVAAEPAAPAGEQSAPRATGPVDPAPPQTEEPRKLAPPRTIAGTVRSFEESPARVVVEPEGGGTLTVPVDRNTAIYVQGGAGTIRDVKAGEQVRVSVSGPENRALWVEVMKKDGAPEKPAGSTATPPAVPPGEMAPPQGAGPPGSTAPPPGPATPAGPAGSGR